MTEETTQFLSHPMMRTDDRSGGEDDGPCPMQTERRRKRIEFHVLFIPRGVCVPRSSCCIESSSPGVRTYLLERQMGEVKCSLSLLRPRSSHHVPGLLCKLGAPSKQNLGVGDAGMGDELDPRRMF